MCAMYDVFIGHCGEDKITMALPIYEELKRRRITGFMDITETPVDDGAPPMMLQRVHSTRIALFILSPDFGAKKWPMLELERFLKVVEGEIKNESKNENESKKITTGQKKSLRLIPVFYRLSVNDCKQGTIFEKHPELLQKHGLMDRVAQGDTTVEGILDSLRAVGKLFGVENKHEATNDDTEEMGARRAELINHVCDEIEGVLLSESEGKRDVFRASWYVLSNAAEVELNFSDTSSSSTGLTLEARVMREVLGETAEAKGDGKRVVVIEGDGGVGKSCILRGLGRQKEVKDKFDGGVYFLSLGMEATEATLIKEFLQILRMTGGRSLAESMRTEESLSVVLKSFGDWVRGKRFLLLLDDLWDRKEMEAEVISELIGVLEEGSGSALVVTTRFNSIGPRGRMVEVKAREPQSAEARSMLLRYAGYSKGEVVESEVEKTVEEILRIGGGLPVCLAAMGRSVAQLVQYCEGDRRVAWKKHYAVVSSNREDVVKMGVDGYADLWTTLSASVEVLEEVDGNGMGPSGKWSYGEMHRGLCVFAKPVVVSLEVVGRLWGMEEGDVWKVVRRFADVGLGSLEVRGEGEKDMLRLHDLMHDFAVMCAKSAGEGAVWHRRLLEGYGEVVGIDEDGSDERDGGGRRDGRECREWWKVEGDEYIFRNMSRHLVGGERVLELERVLMRGEWAMARQRGGGGRSWKDDFCKWAEGIEKWKEVTNMTEKMTEDTEMRKRGLWLIRDAMLESWGYLNENGREFGFQMWGRLVREANEIVQEFLKSVGECQERPWVKPLTAIWPRPGSRKVRAELYLGGEASYISWVGGSLCAIGIRGEVVVVDVEEMRVVSKCVLHDGQVQCVIGSVESKRLVSCSRDETVRQWDAVSGKELDMVRLERRAENNGGLGNHVLETACFSADGTVVVGGFGCGRVDMWDAVSGRIIRRSVMQFDCGVEWVTASASGRYVAGRSRTGQFQMWGTVMNQSVGSSTDICPSDVICVAFSPDEKLFAAGTAGFLDRAVLFCSVVSGREEGEPLNVGAWIHSLAFSSDEKQLAVGTEEGAQIWKVESRELLRTFPFDRYGCITCVRFCQDDEYLLAVNNDSLLHVLKVDWTLDEDEKPAFCHKNAVTFVCASPDGSFVVSGSEDNAAVVWDANQHVSRGPALEHGCKVYYGVVSADSRLIATACSDGTMRIWDARECKQIGHPLRGHSGLVTSVAFSPDGKLLFSGSTDETVRIWNVPDQAQVGIAIGKRVEESGVGMGAASEGGRHSGGESNEHEELQCHAEVICVAVTPDGRRVICSTRGGKMLMWDIVTSKFVCEEAGPEYGASHIQFREANRVVAISENKLPMHWHMDEHRGLVRVPEDEGEGMAQFFDREDFKGRYRELLITRDLWELKWRVDGRKLGTFPEGVRGASWVYDERSGMIVVGDEVGQVSFCQLIRKTRKLVLM